MHNNLKGSWRRIRKKSKREGEGGGRENMLSIFIIFNYPKPNLDRPTFCILHFRLVPAGTCIINA